VTGRIDQGSTQRHVRCDAGAFPPFRLSALLLVVLAVQAPARAGYVDEVTKDRPLGWWRFADAASAEGSVARDEMGRHPGVYRGGVTREAGMPQIGGRAAKFDGKRTCVEVPHHADFARNALSVEFWLKSTQRLDGPYWPASATLVTKATEGVSSGDWCIVAGSTAPGRNQGRVIAATGPKGPGEDTKLLSRARLNDGRWHHVVWTRSAAGLCTLYVDGKLADRASDGGGPIINGRPIQIGGEVILPNGKFFDGSLAEVAIYAEVLPAERVRAHWAAAIPAGGQESTPGEPEPGKILESIVLENQAGLRWVLDRRQCGWTLGTVSLRGKPVDAPITAGVLMLRHVDTDDERWLAASEARRLDERTVRLSGKHPIDGVGFRFEMDLALRPDSAAAAIRPRWSVDKPLDGWEVCLAYHGSGMHEWRSTVYPFAGNSPAVALQPMVCVGVPAVVVFRPDLSLVSLLGIDPASDYLNPTTWAGTTGYHAKSGVIAPQYRVCGGKMSPGVEYALPIQVFLSDAGTSTRAITALVRDWIQVNRYEVQPMFVRTPDEALTLYMKGRRGTTMWKPGIGYQLQDVWAAVYIPVSPQSAYFEYLLYQETGDPLWRRRAIEQIDFVLKAQIADPKSPLDGTIHTCYLIDRRQFNSDDRGSNPGYKVDMNVHTARYMLQTWELLKRREGIDRRDWYEAAVRAVDWALAQQNPDGGLPQKLDYKTLKRSVSVCSGRTMAGLPIIARITGNPKYWKTLDRLEQFLRTQVEDRFWYTGQHPDLFPEDFESDSVWGIVEYWLGKYDRTGDRECLAHARANACFALLMLCPKQLSWVKRPTQTCHAEQLHYLQYSNYAYHNRKLYCLDRLGKLGDPLFGRLFERIMQCGFWAQVTEGNYCGAQHERMADPWKKVSGDVDSLGTLYLNELALDANLQLLEMGMMRAGKEEGKRRAGP